MCLYRIYGVQRIIFCKLLHVYMRCQTPACYHITDSSLQVLVLLWHQGLGPEPPDQDQHHEPEQAGQALQPGALSVHQDGPREATVGENPGQTLVRGRQDGIRTILNKLLIHVLLEFRFSSVSQFAVIKLSL